MSAMDIDKPLDEIIASKPRGGGRGRGRRGGAPRAEGAAPAAGGARARYAGAAPRSSGRAAPGPTAGGQGKKPIVGDATKIIISNLPADVNEAQVRDLMQSTVGPVRAVQMSYTATGKSTGTATVNFRNKGDANKAHTAYHNRMIDNQRPMKVEIAVDPNALVSLATRVAQPPAAAPKKGPVGGRRAPRPRAPRPAKKTAEDLDAEMAAYKSTTAA